jgi:hypothetical protein
MAEFIHLFEGLEEFHVSGFRFQDLVSGLLSLEFEEFEDLPAASRVSGLKGLGFEIWNLVLEFETRFP